MMWLIKPMCNYTIGRGDKCYMEKVCFWHTMLSLIRPKGRAYDGRSIIGWPRYNKGAGNVLSTSIVLQNTISWITSPGLSLWGTFINCNWPPSAKYRVLTLCKQTIIAPLIDPKVFFIGTLLLPVCQPIVCSFGQFPGRLFDDTLISDT